MTAPGDDGAARRIGPATRTAAVIGWPITHSRSPAMHGAAFAALAIDAVFVALAVPPPVLAFAVRGLAAARFLGLSVTVPHKEAIVPLCARLAPPADRIGAVNCVVFEGDAIVGHNTDAGGFVDGLADAGVAAAGRRAVLLGAGGAARAVHAGLVDAGAAEVRVVARRPEACAWAAAAPWTAAALDAALAAADLVVDCTPSALDPPAERVVVDALPLDRLRAGAVVASLVYHRRPRLLDEAAARGCVTVDGKGMLAHQGARAFTLWLGRPAPVEVMRAAI